jgi:hypothetical protein
MPDIRITLRPGSPDQDPREVLEVLGAGDDEELARTVTQLIENEPRVLEFLAQQPEKLQNFARDPWAVIQEQFPELEPPRAVDPIVATDRVTLELIPLDEPNPAIPLLEEVWKFVSENEANLESFMANPFAVVASVGAQSSPTVVEQVNRALETVLNIFRIELTRPTVEALLTIGVRRPR